MTRLSCHRFHSNEGRWLSVIAYNLGNLWRRLVLLLRNSLGRIQGNEYEPHGFGLGT
jgi:hypothetical protein